MIYKKKSLIPHTDRGNFSLKMGYKPGKVNFLFFSLLKHSSRDQMVLTLDSKNAEIREDEDQFWRTMQGHEFWDEWIKQLEYFYGNMPETEVNKEQCPCLYRREESDNMQINQQDKIREQQMQ